MKICMLLMLMAVFTGVAYVPMRPNVPMRPKTKDGAPAAPDSIPA
jgi:hypothetical protein